MNREHILAILWLRWRLTRNQFARAGKVNAVLSVFMLVALVSAALAALVGGFLVGLFALAKTQPLGLLAFWDVALLVFLMFWISGLLVEIQRSESIDLVRLLHLPVTLEQVFLFNYFASLLTPSILIFLPGMLAVCLALVISRGPLMILMIPVVLGFVLMLTAWTYCLRGWIASLMSNQRRKRSILVWMTLGLVFMSQLPNFIVNSPLFRKRHAVVQNIPFRNRDQFVAAHLLVPPGWVGHAAMSLANREPWSALGAVVLSCLLGAYGLKRAYRTTLKVYRGVEAPAKKSEARPKLPRSGPLLVERKLPWLPEEAAALTLATLRSLLRAPETRMALLMPVVAGIGAFSALVARPKGPISLPLAPFITGFLAVFAVFCFANLMANMFGLDRSGFRALVLLPARRHHILLAKNLAILPLVGSVGTVFLLLLSVFLHLHWSVILTGILQLLIAFFVFSLLCNVLSILVPYRFSPGTLSTKKPKAVVFLAVLATMITLPLALIPVSIPPGVQLLFNTLGWTAWLPVNLLSALLLAGFVGWLYWVLLPEQGRLLQRRERKILSLVTEPLE